MSVETALAEVSHHTAPRGQRTARARGGARHGRGLDDCSSSRAGALRPLLGARREAARLAVGAAVGGPAAHRAAHR